MLEAQILRDYLSDHGVAVRIDGEHLGSARGELPMEFPRLYLLDADDTLRARELLAVYERRSHCPSIWRCDCGETVPLHFELCWSCGEVRV